jgi:cell division protein FtsN
LTAADTQVASIDSEPEAVPAAKPKKAASPASSGGGYVVQLGSYRSEAEALAEMDRLKSRHGNVLGAMPTLISEATVAGSKRYRAGVTAGSREAANRVCSSLLSRGERDCLVRRQ